MDDGNRGRLTKDGIRIYEARDFEGMRGAGRLAAEILDAMTPLVEVGQTTGELDRVITQMVEDAGAKSATIGYKGYQHASCISVNHVVCHGIPGPKVLKDGDILNIDVTVIVDGWYGDTIADVRGGQAGAQGRAADRGDARRAVQGDRGGASRAIPLATSATRSRRFVEAQPDVGGARFLRSRAGPGVPRAAQCAALRPPRHRRRCWKKACSSPSSRW